MYRSAGQSSRYQYPFWAKKNFKKDYPIFTLNKNFLEIFLHFKIFTGLINFQCFSYQLWSERSEPSSKTPEPPNKRLNKKWLKKFHRKREEEQPFPMISPVTFRITSKRSIGFRTRRISPKSDSYEGGGTINELRNEKKQRKRFIKD